jgi:hypothetical protein
MDEWSATQDVSLSKEEEKRMRVCVCTERRERRGKIDFFRLCLRLGRRKCQSFLPFLLSSR